MLSAALFDIDGTLINCGGISGKSFDQAFEDLFGQPGASIGMFKSGRTDFAIAQDAARSKLGRELTPEEMGKLNQRFGQTTREQLLNATSFEILPGVTQLINHLSRADVSLGLQTGNIEITGRAKLEHAKLNSYFSFGGFCTGLVDRAAVVRSAVEAALSLNSKLSRERVFVIGDTPHDISAAKANGCVSIGVATGKFNFSDLSKENPDHLFETLEDIPRFSKILGIE